MTPAISVSNLVKTYGDFQAVKNISFEVPAGKIYGLLGSNGAGKTTTISMLLGLLTITGGKISIFGLKMPQARREIASLMNFSSPYVDLPGQLTVLENLNVYGGLYQVKNLRARIDELTQMLKLGDFYKRQYRSLSAGQKTRVSLAKALINTPRLLMLDEPTASLDPDVADWMRGMFETYQRENNATILLASHNMPEVERLCEHVFVMSEGSIVAEGAPAALIEKYGRKNMEEVFLHIVRGGNMEAAL